MNKEKKNRLMLFYAVWMTIIATIGFIISKGAPLQSTLGAILITIMSLLPASLWCGGKAKGLPIFPVFSITYLWAFAMPLVSRNAVIIIYSEDEQLMAAIKVTVFLAIATVIWYSIVYRNHLAPAKIRSFSKNNSESFFIFVLLMADLFYMSNVGGWIYLRPDIKSIIRAILLGLNFLGTFALSYRLGTKELKGIKAYIFILLFSLYLASSAMGLLLVESLSFSFLSFVGYAIGRKKLPWLTVMMILICAAFLHLGKGDMRQKYWQPDHPYFVQPREYPARFSEWINYAKSYRKRSKIRVVAKEEEKQSFLERSGLIQLLLMVQRKSPKEIHYMNGETYKIIPRVIIPRYFNANKIMSHEGTYLLGIHYGMITREEAGKYTIGWGLFNEAYANYGFGGCVVLAIILGLFYGNVTRWAMNTPIISYRSLFAIVVLSVAFQSEFSAGVYVSALLQTTIALTGASIFMVTQKNPALVSRG